MSKQQRLCWPASGRNGRERILPDRLGGFLGFILNLVPNLFAIDPFLIYKTSTRRAYELRLHREPFDEYRNSYRRIVLFLNLLNCIYVFTLGCNRLLIGSLRRKALLAHWPMEEYIWRLELMERLSDTLGDVLVQDPRLAASLYLNSLLGTLILLIGLPYHYAHSPVDAPVLRFMMRPKLEIHQATRQTLAHLRSIELSISETYQQLTCRTSRCNEPVRTVLHWPGEGPFLRQCTRQLWLVRQVHRDRSLVEQFRVHYYSKHSFERLTRFAWLAVLVGGLGALSATVLVCTSSLTIVSAGLENRAPPAPVRQYELFGNLQRLSWTQMFVVAEILGNMSACVFATMSVISIYFIQSRQHLHMIASTRSELCRLHADLRERPALASSASPTLDCRQDLVLLQTLSRLHAFGLDSHRSVGFMSQLLTAVVLVSLTVALTTLVSQAFVLEDIHYDLQTPIVGTVWIYTNFLLIAASSIPSRMVAAKKIVWSILAEQARLSSRASKSATSSMPHSDPLIGIWRREILNNDFIFNHCSVRVLGIGMTFGRILQVNFLIMSISSWIKARN